jgi:hypothetical protein
MADDQLTIVLNQQLAVELSQPQFMDMMQKISAYEVQSANVKVTSAEEYQMAADSLVAVAEVGKGLEGMRVRIVAYPNTFVKTVNATFKGLKERCLRTRERLEYHAIKFKDKADAAFAKQQAEIEAAREVTPEANVAEVDVDGPVQMTLPEQAPEAPLQSTKASEGAGSVSYRTGRPKVTVENGVKLIRAALSDKNKVPMDVVSIDAGALRKAVEAGVMTTKKWASYGVVIEETKDMVVRT